ncbi:T9SS type A sorting domain-containing protein [Pontibacter burrus]|uniref:T9SS type A sorting domain-containing protein n=1 Tax=Pontibacter burrus TaxID=2704466 RepID=A0A6B3LZH7_9BACT|nr:T9SS type A sorting domain-containing protein [Pontibacter burrus]NEM99070.1 T9SS type A sorting domain-containing protein [Pontibacter burrus]
MKQLYFTSHFLSQLAKAFKHSKLLFLLLILVPVVTHGQFRLRWANISGLPTGNAAVAVGNDQNPVYLTSEKANNGYANPHLKKMNPGGGTHWILELSNGMFQHKMDSQDNIYVLGTNSITKVNASGQVTWNHDLTQYNLQADNIELDEHDNAYVTGTTNTSAISVIKISPSGERVWLSTIQYDLDLSRRPFVTIGDEVYVGFSERGNGNASFVTLLKIGKAAGDTLLQKKIKDAQVFQNYYLEAMRWHSSGSLHLFIMNSPATSTLVLKLNTTGEIIWRNNFRSEDRNYFSDATLDEQGNILLLTSVQLSNNRPNSFSVAKLSNTGQTLWHHTYNNSASRSASGRGIDLLSDGNIAVIGSVFDSDNNRSVLMQLYSTVGDLITEHHHRPTSGGDPEGVDLAADDEGNLYVAAYYESLLVMKYTASFDCILPHVKASGSTIDCNTGTAQLTATSPFSDNAIFSWTGPEGFTSNEQNPLVSVAGNYRITVTLPDSDCKTSTTVTVLPAGSTTCYTITFDDDPHGLITATQTKAGTVNIFGKNRRPDGTYATENHAAIFDTGMPTGDDDDLHTMDWGKALIINQDLGDEPNDNQWGGELILDFSAFGPVTMESLRALDIDAYEDDSWVYLYDGDGNELHKVRLQPLGNNSRQEVYLGNTAGVMQLRIVLNGTEGLVGSAAVDNIRFCTKTEPCEEPETENRLTAYAAPTLFSDKTTIAFQATEAAPYTVTLHDLRGNLIGELATGTTIAGETKEVEVDGTALPNGMYIARIISGSQSKAVKLILRR